MKLIPEDCEHTADVLNCCADLLEVVAGSVALDKDGDMPDLTYRSSQGLYHLASMIAERLNAEADRISETKVA